MATQFTYPGIYIQEFTPGAPIQGVGTSTGAFIGTALSGPIGQPTQLTSWDEFQSIFGGFIPNPPASYLPAAVYGFFLNGGVTCYIVRVGTGKMAFANLPVRQPAPAPTDLVATALTEGLPGNYISVTVADSSRLATMLQQAGSSATTLTAVHANTTISNLDSAGITLTVGSNAGFAVGDHIQLDNGPTNQATAIIQSLQGTTIMVLAAPVANPSNYVTGGTGTVRIDDFRPGQLSFRVVVPQGLILSQALPAGALISITGAASEIVTVASAGGDTITLSQGLANTYPMAGPQYPQIASLEFNLTILNAFTGQKELWQQLSMNSLHPGYWKSAVNSQIISLSLPSAPPPQIPSDPRPADGNYQLANGVDDDRTTALQQLTQNPLPYLQTLDALQDVDIVAIPGVTDSNAQGVLIDHCQTLANRFAVLDSVQDTSVGYPNLLAQRASLTSVNGFAALYFPWIQVVNPLTGNTEYWPPCGHVMGIYAQTDQSRGVYKAPANVPIAGAIGLQSLLTNADQGNLNPLGINALRVFPEQNQPMVWGARTIASDSDWQYVNVRRLFIYLEQSIEQGIRWAVFEPNNPSLWKKLTRTISEFLTRVQNDGGILNYYVRIDAALNPPSTQALGQLYVEVGIQPTYPAEFIILRIGIWQGGSTVTES